MRSLLAKTERQLSKLNAQTKLINANKCMSGGEKRRRLDVLLKQKNMITEGVVKKLKS